MKYAKFFFQMTFWMSIGLQSGNALADLADENSRETEANPSPNADEKKIKSGTRGQRGGPGSESSSSHEMPGGLPQGLPQGVPIKGINQNSSQTGQERLDLKPDTSKSDTSKTDISKTDISKPESDITPPGGGASIGTRDGKHKDSRSKKNLKTTPVKFRADGMTGNRYQGQIQLKGNVQIVQGDLFIRGDEARIEQDPKQGQLDRVTVEGKVFLERIDEVSGKKITASARSAIYSATYRTITFKGNASITRGTDRMNGNIINYDLTTGLIKAEKVDGMIQQNDQ